MLSKRLCQQVPATTVRSRGRGGRGVLKKVSFVWPNFPQHSPTSNYLQPTMKFMKSSVRALVVLLCAEILGTSYAQSCVGFCGSFSCVTEACCGCESYCTKSCCDDFEEVCAPSTAPSAVPSKTPSAVPSKAPVVAPVQGCVPLQCNILEHMATGPLHNGNAGGSAFYIANACIILALECRVTAYYIYTGCAYYYCCGLQIVLSPYVRSEGPDMLDQLCLHPRIQYSP